MAILLLRLTLRKNLKPTTPRLVYRQVHWPRFGPPWGTSGTPAPSCCSPRSFFLTSHKAASVVGFLGYVGILLSLMGLDAVGQMVGSVLFWPLRPLLVWLFSSRTAVLGCWYGLYFGILTRDLASVCSDNMANRGLTHRITTTANRRDPSPVLPR